MSPRRMPSSAACTLPPGGSSSSATRWTRRSRAPRRDPGVCAQSPY